MPDITLASSVGRGGVNAREDVAAIQQGLNTRVGDLGLGVLRSDGMMDEPTMTAIGRYQSFVMGMPSGGRIDPGGAMVSRLSDSSPSTLLRERLAAQAVQRNLSGAAWFRANQARFPNSDRISDLAPGFAVQVDSFVAMLRRASASVRVSSTRRNRNRAWLMHYAWMVAHGQIKPDAVPENKEVDIHWDHGDARASRKAAQAMVNLFHIRFKPSLTSNHIDGTAIDMTISWDQAITVTDASGKTVWIDHPRSGSSNGDLHRVGATYGVRKLATDPPHWSADGH
ncbi:hypothetical protein [Novosphingobium rosa]|uniref:hypothetical protein n=1 Tax=Novosphingobium rosa TaxID=76978 RepID=UPI000B2D1055|nr:hypothetical protein [Novosphingobium rosa]